MAQDYSSWGWAGSGYAERVYIEVWHEAIEVELNRSTFGYRIWNNSNNSYGDTGSISWRISDMWNSSRVSGSRGNTPTTGYNQVVIYTSGYFNIYHESDGTLRDVTFTLHISRALGNSRSVTVNVNVTGIPTIPRASSFSSINSLTVPDQSSVGFNISSASSGFRHTVDVMIGGSILVSKGSLAGGSNSIGLTKARIDKIIASMPNSTSLTMSLRMSTWSGSRQIGSTVSKSFTAYLGGSIVPILNSLTHEESVAIVKNNFSVYVRDKSQVKVSVTRSAGQSASIKETSITIAGVKYKCTSATSSVLTAVGNVTITAEVIDSRNRKASKSTTISVVDYKQPTISTLTAIRSDSTGKPMDESMIATVRLVYAGAPVSNQNKVSFKLEYRKKGSGTFSLWTSSTGITNDKTYTSGSIFDLNNTYEIRLSVTDVFQTVTRITELSTAFTLVDYRHTGHGIAFGKVSESDNFEVDLPAVFNQNLVGRGLLYQKSRKVIDFNSIPDYQGQIDFNTLWRHQVYNFNNSGNANNSPNSPKLGAGWLWVRTLNDYTDININEPWLYVWQTFQSLDGRVATRSYNTNANGVGVWSAWSYLMRDTDLGGDKLLEYGSNSNGQYWKYESGKLECQHVVSSANNATPTAWGGMYYLYFSTEKWVYPMKFVDALPELHCMPSGGIFAVDNNYLDECNGLYQLRPVSTGFRGNRVTIRAVGRWK